MRRWCDHGLTDSFDRILKAENPVNYIECDKIRFLEVLTLACVQLLYQIADFWRSEDDKHWSFVYIWNDKKFDAGRYKNSI